MHRSTRHTGSSAARLPTKTPDLDHARANPLRDVQLTDTRQITDLTQLTQLPCAGWLRNGHVQTLLGASPLRKRRARTSATNLVAQTKVRRITAADGAVLEAHCTFHDPAPATDSAPQPGTVASGQPPISTPGPESRLVIIVHGWLGEANSAYVTSAGQALFNAGYDVARVNLRDHGDTLHWNEAPFHSGLIDETRDVIAQLATEQPRAFVGLLGFSLGGNFVVRAPLATLAGPARSRSAAWPTPDMSCIDGVVAVSPLMNPARSIEAMDRGWTLYRHAFAYRWRRILDAKNEHFANRFDFDHARHLNTVYGLTDWFAHRHTPYGTSREYFGYYTLNRAFLDSLQVPVHIVTAQDDPIIPYSDAVELTHNPLVSLNLTDHGGHCAFLTNANCDNWIDTEIIAAFARQRASAGTSQ